MDDHTLSALKALTAADRLRIAGTLAAQPQTAASLASSLALAPRELARHLALLRAGGLIGEVAGAQAGVLGLRIERLAELGRELDALGREEGPSAAADMLAGPDGLPRPAAEAKVLRSFFVDGRLQTIPAQGRKRQVVLRFLAETVFTEARDYAEKEVNQLLALRHPDVASLRRYLVDHGYVERDHGQYRARGREAWPPLDV